MDAIRVSSGRKGVGRLLPVLLLAISGTVLAEAPPPPPPVPPQSDFVFPQAVYNPPPRYPTGSADDYESGTVVLVLDVDPEGAISKVAMDRSSGYPKLDAAAIEAAAAWRFTPAQEGGKPIRSRVRVPVTFVAE
ncbi:energy transducer TonB [Stenotrophomonas oahuensis]|uniref:Energy transducer TonB n=1 Tax=Stenotrophomonas oahuensis TaxID=3003271 RepID=A0ABY9YTI4_9GAMM|nr:energy transducer TonB [Stenotrophomonas sp. A5586]WNH54182.1 energy transducer TonB [Stenotrophomonas sp. A5586]